MRRVEVTKRGKRDYNYSWPKDDLAVMRAAWEKYRAVYRRYWTEADPGGTYRLTQSAFWGHALMEALKDLDPWLPTVRNDARKEPLAGGREQVGLVWPVEVENAVVDLWETIDKSRFPDGFSLTKQHLASAAILHGLKTADEWVLACRNDDRYNVPVEADGRLRINKAPLVVGEGEPEGRCDG